jgi:hypothetical protein
MFSTPRQAKQNSQDSKIKRKRGRPKKNTSSEERILESHSSKHQNRSSSLDDFQPKKKLEISLSPNQKEP